MTILVRTTLQPHLLTPVTREELVDFERWGFLLTDLTRLYSNWFTYEGGPSTDVESLTITITKVGQGSPIVGPTAAGINNVGVGNYEFMWSEEDRDGPGDYSVVWNAIDLAGEPAVASETVTLPA